MKVNIDISSPQSTQYFQTFPVCILATLLASTLGSPLLDILGPLGSVLQDMGEAMEGMDGMAAAGDMAAGAMETAETMEAMAAPAMTMSFLLPGIGLGLLKGMLLGISYFKTAPQS